MLLGQKLRVLFRKNRVESIRSRFGHAHSVHRMQNAVPVTTASRERRRSW